MLEGWDAGMLEAEKTKSAPLRRDVPCAAFPPGSPPGKNALTGKAAHAILGDDLGTIFRPSRLSGLCDQVTLKVSRGTSVTAWYSRTMGSSQVSRLFRRII